MSEADMKQVACYKMIPDDQRMSIRLKPAPGAMMKASTVGATIRSMSRLLKVCADHAGTNEEVFVTGMSMSEEEGIEIEFSVLPSCEP